MFQQKPKNLFYLLVLLFFMPICAAWYLFTYHSHWIQHTTNHGKLIQPLLPIENLTLNDYLLNRTINPNSWKNYWVMLYLKKNNCDAGCLTNIYLMGQTKKALGKYQNQVLTAYVAIDSAPANRPPAKLLQEYPHTLLLKANASMVQHFFAHYLNASNLIQGQLFLVDPHGFVMMTYPGTVNFEDVYQDLNHLLKLEADA